MLRLTENVRSSSGSVHVGDAAISFDPLSSQGLITALYTGLRAGEAIDRALSRPGESVESAWLAAQGALAGTAYEFDWRLSQPGYGAGRFPAEELRRAGQDEPFAAGQAVVWQPRVGAAAVVDTLLVTDDGPAVLTPFEDWPVRRANVRGELFDIPDILVRTD